MDRIGKLQEFLKDNPSDAFVQHALALEYIKLGNDAAAKQLFKDILQREPGYIGSYYHLGKLLEREEDFEEAILIYETGMAEAKNVNDRHAYNELQMAKEDIEMG